MQCCFDRAWVGQCTKKAQQGQKVCTEHSVEKCRCGKQAVRECSATSSLVCGHPLCEDRACRYNHVVKSHLSAGYSSTLDSLSVEVSLLTIAEYADLDNRVLLEGLDGMKENIFDTIDKYKKHLPTKMDIHVNSWNLQYKLCLILKAFTEKEKFFNPKTDKVVFEEIEEGTKVTLTKQDSSCTVLCLEHEGSNPDCDVLKNLSTVYYI